VAGAEVAVLGLRHALVQRVCEFAERSAEQPDERLRTGIVVDVV
jgi:hypothetical protein